VARVGGSANDYASFTDHVRVDLSACASSRPNWGLCIGTGLQQIVSANPPYDPLSDTLYRGYLLSTIIGVAGGLSGVGLLLWQTVLTRRSADAAKDTALAAKLGAEAVIRSERPWIFVEQSEGTGGLEP
jgi:hypothetical protein